MTCLNIGEFGINGIADLLVYPTSCYYYFYAVLLGGLFGILVTITYFSEKKTLLKPDIISTLGVHSIVIWFLGLIGTLIKSTDGIPMIQTDIFIYITAFAIVFCAIWFFKN